MKVSRALWNVEIKRYNGKEQLLGNSIGIVVTKYTSSLDGLYFLEKALKANGAVVSDTI